MVRLKVMPLVSDFGEILNNPLETLRPLTQMVFTQDYRIFGQFSNFIDDMSDATRPGHIKTVASPSLLRIVVTHEDEEMENEYIEVDGTSENMSMVVASQLKNLDMPHDTTPNNMAIKAFIDRLADDTPVILYWI